MKTTIGIVVAIVIAVLGFAAFSFFGPETANAPKSYDGKKVGIADLISVEAPYVDQTVFNPVYITGTARGTWYFEASFPIDILDANGNVIGQGHAEAQSDWMTEDYVPFKAYVDFTYEGNGPGIVRLKNDNPSGDPARDKHIDIPVMLNTTAILD